MAATILPSIRPNAEDLWKTAVAELSEQDKAALNLDRADKLDAISQSLELANNAADRYKKKTPRFRRSEGKEVVIARDVFAKVARWISHFKEVGDTIVQYDPTHAALPWAGVRFVLQICVDYFETHDFLLEKIEQIAEQISRCRLIEKHLLRSSSPIVDEVKQVLVKLYAAILAFLAQTKAHLQKDTKAQVLGSLKLKSKQFDAAFQAIVTAKDDMERCLQMAIGQEVFDGFTTVTNELSELKRPMTRWSGELTKITDGLGRSRRAAILKWISSEPHLQYHKRERETFLEGTGSWLISHSVFRKWKDESASSLLWLHGIPGSGKSKLTSLVIEDALEAFQNQQAPSPAYFYCSRNPAEPGRSDPEKILASIVRQLSSFGPGKPLLQPTIKTYDSQEDEGFPIHSLQLQDSYDLLLQILGSYPTAIIIIDALDECNQQTRQKLLNKLQDILHKSPTLVKIFVSSRDDQDIKYNLRGYPTLELSSGLNSGDISHFVECETKLLIKQGRLLQLSNRKLELSRKIRWEISDGAHGMFRWASLQLAALCDLVTDGAILERLGRLPRSLEELYEEILSKIQHYSAKTDRIYAENALAWLLCSQRKLKSHEFLTAISTSDRSPEPLSKDQVLQLCCNLVVFDLSDDSFRFAHLSVREFLEARSAYCASTINSIVARVCLKTLMACDGAAQTSDLYSYASYFWAAHCEDADNEREKGPLQILLEEFLSNTAPQAPFGTWNGYKFDYKFDYLNGWRLYSKLRDSQQHRPCRLVVASLFNFVGIIKSELQQKPDPKKLHDCARLSASHGAIRASKLLFGSNNFTVTEDIATAAAGNDRNGIEITTLLLEKCSRVEITEGIVAAAAGNGHAGIKIMTLFLEKCNRVEVTEAMVKTVIDNLEGGTEMMALLLENCSPINITDGMVTAMVRNPTKGKAVLSLLLDKCNNIEITESMVKAAVGNEFESRLSAGEVIGMLLKRCNQVKVTGRMVDAAAVNWPNGGAVLAQLLNKCNELKIPEGTAGTSENNLPTGNEVLILRPDWRTTVREHINVRLEKEVIALLLQKKASQTEVKENAIQATGDIEDGEIIALLIERNRHKNEITETTIKAARDNKNCRAVALLLIEKDGQKEVTDNVVKATADDGKREIMTLLIKKDNDQITDLVNIAASNPNSELMALLLEKCDDRVRITEKVVKAAASNSNSRIMSLLLKTKGRQIMITNNVLKAAVENENGEIMVLLIEQDHEHITDLMKIAVSNWNSKVVARFFERTSQVKITEDILKIAAGNSNSKVMALVLRKAGQVAITEEVVKVAAGNWNSDVMALLLENGVQAQITEDVVEIAARNPNSKLIALLLENGSKAKVTEEAVKFAAGNRNRNVMALLLEKCQVIISRDIVIAAASNWESGVMDLLLEKESKQFRGTEDISKRRQPSAPWEYLWLDLAID
ncbi:hypothetical protein GGR51DRAFT_426684 [Nemania sp. FL0031]|nr:hypothetical protein GGR51DRAFT_426684 [Nemania sp. FL0031]